ncbi:MAG: hypothetical protein ACMUIA_04435 [bacterium]
MGTVQKHISIKEFIRQFGGSFSSTLGIDLSSRSNHEIFKWFLASLLFGARITERIAIHTYREFESAHILSPERILETGWDGLVAVLDRGSYVRYDYKTATKLLEIAERLRVEYKSDLNRLHDAASGPRDLEEKLKALGKGVGDVTVNIFLREMRGIWEKARPVPGAFVIAAARELGLLDDGMTGEEALMRLESLWEKDKNTVEGAKFADFEAAMVRFGREGLRKKRKG